jgi:hypothetical protein
MEGKGFATSLRATHVIRQTMEGERLVAVQHGGPAQQLLAPPVLESEVDPGLKKVAEETQLCRARV